MTGRERCRETRKRQNSTRMNYAGGGMLGFPESLCWFDAIAANLSGFLTTYINYFIIWSHAYEVMYSANMVYFWVKRRCHIQLTNRYEWLWAAVYGYMAVLAHKGTYVHCKWPKYAYVYKAFGYKAHIGIQGWILPFPQEKKLSMVLSLTATQTLSLALWVLLS